MTVLVKDIVQGLCANELYGTNFFNKEDITQVNEKQWPRLLILIRDAVDTFYRNLSIQQKSVWLMPMPNRLDYLLQGQQPYLIQGKTNNDLSVFPEYPCDEYGLPTVPEHKRWDDDLKKVRGIYTIDGQYVPMNESGRKFSVFLPKFNQISLLGPMQYRYLNIIYDIRSPYLEGMDSDTLLPEVTILALRYHVAMAVYMTVGTEERETRLPFYTQEYANAMAALKEAETFSPKEMVFNREIIRRKWN